MWAPVRSTAPSSAWPVTLAPRQGQLAAGEEGAIQRWLSGVFHLASGQGEASRVGIGCGARIGGYPAYRSSCSGAAQAAGAAARSPHLTADIASRSTTRLTATVTECADPA